jgi:hypothetical protein
MLNWPIKTRLRPNKEEDEARDVITIMFHSANLPFRLPSTRERLRQAELLEIFSNLKVTRSCAAGPIADDAVDNSFVPSALLGAMRGSSTEGFEGHLFKGTAIAIRTLQHNALNKLYADLKIKVSRMILDEETSRILGRENAAKAVNSIHYTGFPEDVWNVINDEWLAGIIEAATHCCKPIVRGLTQMKESHIPFLLRLTKSEEEEGDPPSALIMQAEENTWTAVSPTLVQMILQMQVTHFEPEEIIRVLPLPISGIDMKCLNM